jgi:cytochrome c6
MAIPNSTWWIMVLTRISFILFLVCLSSCGNDNSSENNDALPMESPAEKGASLFTLHCASCHGDNGKLGASGAKDLTMSTLTDRQVLHILKQGKNAMPPMSTILENKENMELVIQHIKTLRK